MLELLWELFLFFLQLVEFGLLVFSPISLIMVIWYDLRVSRHCDLTLGRLYSHEYVLIHKLKRDRLNDTYYSTYQTHFFGPDVETIHHTKAYKWVTEERFECEYQYDAGQSRHLMKTNKPVKYEEGRRLDPPQTIELFYMREKPEKCYEKENILTQIWVTLGCMTGFLVLSFTVKGIQVLVGGILLFVLAYVYLIWALRRIKRTVPKI